MLCLKLPIYKLVKMLNRLDFVTKRSREFKSDQNWYCLDIKQVYLSDIVRLHAEYTTIRIDWLKI